MSPPWHRRLVDALGFPRVSGDEPDSQITVDWIAPFSPRERG